MRIKYKAYLCDRESHNVVLAVDITSDGYMSALAAAHKLCAANHPNLYLGKIENG